MSLTALELYFVNQCILNSGKSRFIMEFDEVTKDYNNRIVMVENLPKTDSSTIIEIKEFEEMIDLVNELSLPILCLKDDKKRYACFYVIKDEITYEYILR